FQAGYIYTTGYRETSEYGKNLIITKWSPAGVKLWEIEWGEEHSQVGVAIAVQDNGSIYVIASDYDQIGMPGYTFSSVLKFNPDGTLQWEKSPVFLILYGDLAGTLYIQGEYMYFDYTLGGAVFSLAGEYLTGLNSVSLIPDSNDGFFAAYQVGTESDIEGSQVQLVHYNATGYTNWTTYYYRELIPSRFDRCLPVNMAISPDSQLYMLVFVYPISFEYVLLTYDFDGNLLDNKTIFSKKIVDNILLDVYLVIGNGGVGYFATSIIENEFSTWDVIIQAYQLSELGSGFVLTIPMIIAIGSSAIIVGAVVGIVQRKRKLAEIPMD
ncbi:MAG: hypothetical protein ACFFEV_06390, partial [Candidatus Thorarchaeota archaeon]